MKKNIDMRKFSIVMQADEAEILLYDQIGSSFWGDGISAKQFAEQFNAIGDKVARIVLRINSPGGDVWDGAAIYDLVKASKVPVDVSVDGLAASAAFTVAMAGRKISIGEAGMMMMHNAKAMAMGDAEDMRQTADVIDKISNQMAEIYAKRSGKSMEEVKTLMDAETWMTADECVAMGFADDKCMPEPDDEDKAAQVGATFDLSKFKNVPESLKLRIAALALPKVAKVPAVAAAVSPAEPVTRRMIMAEQTAQAVEVKDNYGATAVEIMKLGQDFKVDVSSCLTNNMSLAEAKEFVSTLYLARMRDEQAARGSGLAAPTVDSMTAQERKEYSICRAIRALAGEKGVDATLEREVSMEISKNINQTTTGIFIPTRLNPRASGLDTKTNAAGKYSVATEVRDLIELLRARIRCVQMGATVLSGLQGNVQFPTQATAGTLVWTGENPGSDVTQADITFGVRTMTPKTCQATTAFSRQLLAQSTVDVEALVREDLARIHAIGIDAAAINGLGSGNQPTGLLKTTGIGAVYIGSDTSGSGNGGAPTYATCVDLETSVANSNADEAGMAFLTTPVMRGKLKKVGKLDSTYASIPLWDQWGNAPGVGDLIGYPAYVSNNVPSTLTKGTSTDCHAIIFGYWPSLVIGEWGVIELVVDPYTAAKQGMINVTSFQMVDVCLRQPAQFAACQGARNV